MEEIAREQNMDEMLAMIAIVRKLALQLNKKDKYDRVGAAGWMDDMSEFMKSDSEEESYEEAKNKQEEPEQQEVEPEQQEETEQALTKTEQATYQ